jgi:hypothetical protein
MHYIAGMYVASAIIMILAFATARPEDPNNPGVPSPGEFSHEKEVHDVRRQVVEL